MNMNLNQGNNIRQQFSKNNNNQNMFLGYNNINQNNNIILKNNYMDFNMIPKNPTNINNLKKNIYNNDERLNIFLSYLGLKKYIINFRKNNISFDDFLSLSNKDFSRIKIPTNIQKFIYKKRNS